MVSFLIQDSVAFVTGTNKKNGIGRAIVHALIAQGARKVYATARNVDQLQELVESYPQGTIVPVALDVTDLAAIAKLPEQYPDVTLVVNNAGYFGGVSSLGDLHVAQKEIAVNYVAPLAIVNTFANVLRKNTSKNKDETTTTAAIVNVNSIASLVNFPLGGAYSASKAAAHSLTQAQRRDLPGVLVVGVYPGPIDTDMVEEFEMEKATPRDVAAAVTEALKNGIEDVFPDQMAQQLFQGWKADAKDVERQMATPLA